jgi:hypothetical protein
MTVQEVMKLLAHADPNAEVTMGPGLRAVGSLHIEDGVPDVVFPFVVLLAAETA